MRVRHVAAWPTSKEPSWLGTLPTKWPVQASPTKPTSLLHCRAGQTASVWLWRYPGGQAHLVSCKVFCNSLPCLSNLPVYPTANSLIIAGTVPRDIHAAMRQDTNASALKLEHHLSASQYTQHLVSTLGVKQLRLCEQPAQQKPTVAAFCVDHQLRLESTHECQQAANQASAMGLGSHVMQMHWPELPAIGHLMEQASIMRYQLLQQVCKANQISVLLTGHHAGMHQK